MQQRKITPLKYPKPGPIGGVLIRELIVLLRSHKVEVPLKGSHILIACSGGLDSTALAVLIGRYGRRVVGCAEVSLVHFNHGWRADASNADEAHVAALAKKLGLGFQAFHGEGAPSDNSGFSWENEARVERIEAFKGFVAAIAASKTGKKKAAAQDIKILTAHHADDLAETVLWRLCTGQAETHLGGVLVENDQYIRPFLRFRKAQLEAFLKEEGEVWCVDASNLDRRFLRNQIRIDLVPILRNIFPKVVENLAKLALRAQIKKVGAVKLPQFQLEVQDEVQILGSVLKKIANTRNCRGELVRIQRRQIEALTAWLSESDAFHASRKSLDLGSGWKAIREVEKVVQKGAKKKDDKKAEKIVRWIFEGPVGQKKGVKKTPK